MALIYPTGSRAQAGVSAGFNSATGNRQSAIGNFPIIPREILKKIRQIELRTNRIVSETLAGAYHFVFFGLLFTCFQAAAGSNRPELPAVVTMNQDAGRGGELMVTVQLEGGQILPLVLDTGANATVFDKSLEAKLGKRLGTFVDERSGGKITNNLYMAPELYLGGTRLTTGTEVATRDFKGQSDGAGHPVMGVLGMDVLQHYCIQMDFAAGQMRFLDDERVDKQPWGKAFPIVMLTSEDTRPAVCENLLGMQGPHSLIDSGWNSDGWLMPKYFRQWTNGVVLPADGAARWPNGRFGGETYPFLSLQSPGFESNGIGICFLARHLVTLDFPKHTMYLKRTNTGPLNDDGVSAAANFLKDSMEKGELPGWSKNKHGSAKITKLDFTSNLMMVEMVKNGGSSVYHYRIVRTSRNSPWKLQQAWRTDQNGNAIKEYSIP
jgi:hypothetical protein